jgi:hypothetical protein
LIKFVSRARKQDAIAVLGAPDCRALSEGALPNARVGATQDPLLQDVSRLIEDHPIDLDALPVSLVRAAGISMTGVRRQAPALSRVDVLGRLLPSIPAEHRAMVALAGTLGPRRGEWAGLPWSAVDLDGARVHVRPVLVEVGGTRVV